MYLAPNEEQQALKDAVRRICIEQVTPERLANWSRSPLGYDAAIWKTAVDLGWLGLGVAVQAGGSGLGLSDVAMVIQECGRGLIPRPIINAIAAGFILNKLGASQVLLAAQARGDKRVAFAFDEVDAQEAQYFSTVVDSGLVRGEKSYVSDGATADLHLVAARDSTGVTLALVARPADLTPQRTFDGDRQARVRYAGEASQSILKQGPEGACSLAGTRRWLTALALAEMVGGMEAVIEMTVEYTKQREQFGQKIAVFQAVQHQVGDMATAFTSARHLAWQAITRMEAGTEEKIDLPAAAAFVGQAYKKITLAGHHLHGGAGFVVEHPLHFYSERAQSLCIRHTPERPALAAIASQLLD